MTKTVTFNMSKRSGNTQRITFLAQPKPEYEPNNIFNYQDFRGMLHADHEEALKNSTVAMKSKTSGFSQRFATAPTFNTISSTATKQSLTAKELFPMPDLKTHN
jgi:hypothetical protein